MTGLELIEYVQEKLHRNIQFVILTGYADFEYARMAIRMHVKKLYVKTDPERRIIRYPP